MKFQNPLFHEHENPIDVLRRIQNILCFLKEIQCQGQQEIEISENGQNGLFQILSFLEDTTRQVGDVMAENWGGKKENPEKG